MISVSTTDVRELAEWALHVRSSLPPDFWVGDEADPQMRRWHVVPRNPVHNVFLHEFVHDDPVFHDHPYASTSIILVGSYLELFMDGEHAARSAGDVIERDPLTPHRIVVPGAPALTLFCTGPKIRDWRFFHDGVGVVAKDDPHYAMTRHWRES